MARPIKCAGGASQPMIINMMASGGGQFGCTSHIATAIPPVSGRATFVVCWTEPPARGAAGGESGTGVPLGGLGVEVGEATSDMAIASSLDSPNNMWPEPA